MAFRFPVSNRDGTPKGHLVLTSRDEVSRIAPVDAHRCVLVMRDGSREWVDVSADAADAVFSKGESDDVAHPNNR